MSTQPLLEVKNLSRRFVTKKARMFRPAQTMTAVDDVSLSISRGETLGVVGESGCGKSTLGKMMARLLDPSEGAVLLDGQDIAHRSAAEARSDRRRIQMMFQDPSSSLNPRRTVGSSIAAPFVAQHLTPKGGIGNRVSELMELVGLKPEHINCFPHEFSGGQKQRVGIARALALDPDIIICDEPVSALDVSVQAQVVNLLEKIQRETGVALVFIAHDLSVVKHISHRIAVMYLGRLMELQTSDGLFANPRHPYTQALLSSVPAPDPDERHRERIVLRGELPNPADPPSGCPFRTRCPLFLTLDEAGQEKCRTVKPAATLDVACHFPAEAAEAKSIVARA